jgi:hypothetical protein
MSGPDRLIQRCSPCHRKAAWRAWAPLPPGSSDDQGRERLTFDVFGKMNSSEWAPVTSGKRDYRMQLFDPLGGALASDNSRANPS